MNNRFSKNTITKESRFKNTVCRAQARGVTSEGMKRITPHEARAIAAAAFCDPRSVVKAIEGRPLAALTLTRIKHALAQLGRADLLAASTPPQAA